MSNILQLIRSRFKLHSDNCSLEHRLFFDEKNCGGFPSNVVAFTYNPFSGYVVIATSCGRIQFYGYNGSTWSFNFNENINRDKFEICNLLNISSTIVLALCRERKLICFQFEDGHIRILKISQFPEFPNDSWTVYHLQNFSSESNALIFYMNNTVQRIKTKSLDPEILIDSINIKQWHSGDFGELSSITSFPKEPNFVLLFTKNGNVGFYNKSQLIKTFEFKNADGERIQELHWSPIENIAFCISSNFKYSKWTVIVEKSHEIFLKEMDSCDSNQSGPYPSHKLRNFNVGASLSNIPKDILIFQGGKSSGRHDDRDLVSLKYGTWSEKFEVSSEVVGIEIVHNKSGTSDQDEIILICTSCEIIGVQLSSDKYHILQPKHFVSINNSTPTSHSTIIKVEENIWNTIQNTSRSYWKACNMSNREWPLFFQKDNLELGNYSRLSNRQLYLSGHSNGNICVWENGGLNVSLLLMIRTCEEFETGSFLEENDKKVSENKKRCKTRVQKIGLYDPFDDDEAICITKVILDPQSGFLFATNRGGYVFSYELFEVFQTMPIWTPVQVVCTNIFLNSKNSLKPRGREHCYYPGFHPKKRENSESPLVFLIPSNNKINSLVYLRKYSCLAIGGTFGLVFLNVQYGNIVYTECFEITNCYASNANRSQLTRFKSFKKSLRKTFRKKRKTERETIQKTYFDEISQHGTMEECGGEFVERQIIARDTNVSSTAKIVMCLHSLRFPLLNEKNADDVIAVSLNDGTVLFYTVHEHEVGIRTTFQTEQRTQIHDSCGQNVLNISITNGDEYCPTSTKILMVTDQQVRLYKVNPFEKQESFKLTELEGLRIVNGTISRIESFKNTKQFESFIILITNNGNLRIHSCSRLSQHISMNYINATDPLALSSTSLAEDGSVFHLIRSSELKRNVFRLNHC